MLVVYQLSAFFLSKLCRCNKNQTGGHVVLQQIQSDKYPTQINLAQVQLPPALAPVSDGISLGSADIVPRAGNSIFKHIRKTSCPSHSHFLHVFCLKKNTCLQRERSQVQNPKFKISSLKNGKKDKQPLCRRTEDSGTGPRRPDPLFHSPLPYRQSSAASFPYKNPVFRSLLFNRGSNKMNDEGRGKL